MEKTLRKIYNVPMSFEALLKTDTFMLQKQNENTQARPYTSNTLERKRKPYDRSIQFMDNYGP